MTAEHFNVQPHDAPAHNITIVAAVTRNHAIGQDGDLICRLRPDMRRFRQLTLGHTVLMGRRTWESLGGPLPGRRNIVISRRADLQASGAEVYDSMHTALEAVVPGEEIMVIGGQQIYTLAMPMATRLEITQIDIDAPAADTFFPPVEPSKWIPAPGSEPDTPWQTDPETDIRYRFICLTRK